MIFKKLKSNFYNWRIKYLSLLEFHERWVVCRINIEDGKVWYQNLVMLLFNFVFLGNTWMCMLQTRLWFPSTPYKLTVHSVVYFSLFGLMEGRRIINNKQNMDNPKWSKFQLICWIMNYCHLNMTINFFISKLWTESGSYSIASSFCELLLCQLCSIAFSTNFKTSDWLFIHYNQYHWC